MNIFVVNEAYRQTRKSSTNFFINLTVSFNCCKHLKRLSQVSYVHLSRKISKNPGAYPNLGVKKWVVIKITHA